jgi:DNA-binding response OmpR family regulator
VFKPHAESVSKAQPLEGARVLVAEDEPFLALDIVRMLMKAGATVIGPALSAERALELAIRENLSCGVLDVALRDGLVFPAARALRNKGARIVFHTGQADPASLKRDWPDAQVLVKPCPLRLVVPAVYAACSCPVTDRV